jgi:PPOX class probable F420-dependent enzyme
VSDRDAFLGSTTTTAANRMSKAERDEFLKGPHIGRLATIRPDGFPHVSPIWPVWDGKELHFALAENRVHMKNLRANPRATVIVDEDWRPQTKRYADGAAAVVLRGEVTVLGLDESEEPLGKMFVDHANQYLDGADGDDDYWNTEDGERYHVCTLVPVSIVTWDFRKFHGEQS